MEEKIIENKWEDGALADISAALHRASDIIQTADELTGENAKFKLLEGVNIILADCIDTVKKRMKNGELSTNEPVIGTMDYDD